MGVLFFLIIVTLTPLAVGPDSPLLQRIGPAILWLGALLSSLLGLERMFQADWEDESLDIDLMSGHPLELVVIVKAAAHWVTSGFPLVLGAPLFALFFNVPLLLIGPLVGTLLIGTPALTLIGAVGAALTASLRRGGLLLPVLILPITIPVLIFGVLATASAQTGGAILPPLAVLAALTLVSTIVGPLAAAAALRSGRH